MNSIIDDQPNFEALKDAIKEGVLPLTIFVGSGPSTEAGLPDWKALRSRIQIDIANQQKSYKKFKELNLMTAFINWQKGLNRTGIFSNTVKRF